ncbi:hypothetical protein GCM10028818_55400 [Spirosoma horti]
MTKFDELKKRFPNVIPIQELRQNVSIVELALQYGYEPQLHKGKSRPVLEHPDFKDIIIIKNPQDAAQQIYQRAGDFTDSGTVIDFIRNRLGTVFSKFNRPGDHEFKNITSVLYDYLRIDPDHINQNRKVTASITNGEPKQQFAREQFDIRALSPENYLTKRQIAPETLQRPEFTNKVVAQIAYFDTERGHSESYLIAKEHPERKYLTFTNVAFPYYNGTTNEITGLELRNENVKLHAPGSDRYGSVFVSNTPPKVENFYIMESAIDALSHQQLRSIKGDKDFNSVYFSTGGQLTAQQVDVITRYIGKFEKAPEWSINVAFDNDAKGHRFDLQFIQQLIATKFPMSATVGGVNRVSYLLPEDDAYKPMRESLLARVDGFNKNVQTLFIPSDADQLGQKELANQQIFISVTGKQYALSIPESCPALTMMTKSLLEITGLNQRIVVDKAASKDFNEDLVRMVKQNVKFRYSISDESGQDIYKGNVATLMNRTLNHLKHQVEGEGLSKTFIVNELQPFGFQKPLAEIKIEQGQTVKYEQKPDFIQQIAAEKVHRGPQERTILNPENKPQIEQIPQPRAGDDTQPKLKR